MPVEIATQSIRAGHPNHDGCGIRQQTEVRFAGLLAFSVTLQFSIQ